MQVYRGFDIGTDKIPPEKREGILHHLIDIVDPSAQFTAADFISMALEAIESILQRKKLPIIVGGTGLYLKVLLNGLFPGGKSRPEIRQRLERESREKSLDALWKRLMGVDPVYSQKISKNDKIRIIRALEVFHSTDIPLSEHFSKTQSFVKDFHILKIGLKLERMVLYQKIEERVEKMFERGIIDEVRSLRDSGVAEDAPPFRALGYKHVLKFLSRETGLEETKSLTKRDTRHYAKRQMTWFRRMEGIQWFSPFEFPSIAEYIRKNLK